ncbi:unnamed protein product [Diplocarpon coronariae]
MSKKEKGKTLRRLQKTTSSALKGFIRLAPELQTLIWRECVADMPRVIQVVERTWKGKQEYFGVTNIPPILHTCFLSRSLALKFSTRIVPYGSVINLSWGSAKHDLKDEMLDMAGISLCPVGGSCPSSHKLTTEAWNERHRHLEHKRMVEDYNVRNMALQLSSDFPNRVVTFHNMPRRGKASSAIYILSETFYHASNLKHLTRSRSAGEQQQYEEKRFGFWREYWEFYEPQIRSEILERSAFSAGLGVWEEMHGTCLHHVPRIKICEESYLCKIGRKIKMAVLHQMPKPKLEA